MKKIFFSLCSLLVFFQTNHNLNPEPKQSIDLFSFGLIWVSIFFVLLLEKYGIKKISITTTKVIQSIIIFLIFCFVIWFDIFWHLIDQTKITFKSLLSGMDLLAGALQVVCIAIAIFFIRLVIWDKY